MTSSLWAAKAAQNLRLLALWNLGEVQRPPEFCCDLIKCGGDAQVPMGLLKAERRLAGPGGRELERPNPKQCRPIVRAVARHILATSPDNSVA